MRPQARGQELRVAFPPSYVLAGSAIASLTGNGVRRSWHYPENGYQAEWVHVADVAEERAGPETSIDDAISDLLWAVDLADQALPSLRPRWGEVNDVIQNVPWFPRLEIACYSSGSPPGPQAPAG